MTQGGYLAIAISIIVILLAVFIVSFVIYCKTPAPKGCESYKKMSEENCSKCGHKECSFYKEKEAEE